MKTSIKFILFLFVFPLLGLAQKGHGHGHGKSHYKNGGNKVVVYQHAGYSLVKVKRKGPPAWAPAYGYKHRHVYFPEYRCYYDTYTGLYIYRRNGIWIRAYSMPTFLVNIGTTRKVELSIDAEPNPQVYYEQHIVIYN